MDEGIAEVKAVIAATSPARPAFDCLLAYAGAAGFRCVPRLPGAVKSVELQWRSRRSNPYSAQTQANHINFYLRRPILDAHDELEAAARAHFGAIRPNSRGEYRTHLHTVAEVEAMLDFLRAQGAWPNDRQHRRFAAAVYAPLRPQHFDNAVRRVAQGDRGRFGPSTDYDLLFEGQRLPPKAVFGLAATEALGFPVGPKNFSAGEGMLSFQRLRAHGFKIVPKGAPGPDDPLLVSDEDRRWAEGHPRLVTHLRRERAAGLAAAKKTQFRALNGRLFCERCAMDPVQIYGAAAGEACIEVHHQDVQLANMAEGHETRLEDLACLCANCHRVTHRELKSGLP